MVRLSVAGLFMVSGIAAMLGIYGGTRRRVRKIFGPVVVIGLLTVLIYPFRDLLPAFIEPEGMQALLTDPGEFSLLPGFTGLALGSWRLDRRAVRFRRIVAASRTPRPQSGTRDRRGAP